MHAHQCPRARERSEGNQSRVRKRGRKKTNYHEPSPTPPPNVCAELTQLVYAGNDHNNNNNINQATNLFATATGLPLPPPLQPARQRPSLTPAPTSPPHRPQANVHPGPANHQRSHQPRRQQHNSDDNRKPEPLELLHPPVPFHLSLRAPRLLDARPFTPGRPPFRRRV